jgi:protein-disulfide isomerase/uncharacterized membrane protein
MTASTSDSPQKKRTSPAATVASQPARPRAAFAVALVFLALSIAASLILVIQHQSGLALPGCGAGGACDQALRSAWGRIPLGGFDWPVSHAGLAYFLAAAVTWIVVTGSAPTSFRWIARFGAAISALFCAVIVVKHTPCPYCLLAHAGNFGFWITLEVARVRSLRNTQALAVLAGAFVLITGVLAVFEVQHREAAAAEAERKRKESTAEMVRATAGQATRSVRPLTGRYRWGPVDAPIRIVMFTDYQCLDCAQVERQIAELMRERSDLSVAIKHFPFNVDCNPSAGRTLHQNACWAARAAEAAGALWGVDGFWKMHDWLFARNGTFREQRELEDAIRSFGYDPGNFVAVMSSPQTLELVKQDVAEGIELGLFFTPMVFINGVELKGWQAPGAVKRTVAELAATNPPRRTPDNDRPVGAREKMVADWRDWNNGKPIQLPADPNAWVLGPADAPAKVVLWGDYQEPLSAAADKTIRAFVKTHPGMNYTYRHYPFNKECNPRVSESRFPQACLAARAAEAAGDLGGNDGYWRMHAWLMDNQATVSESTLRAAAPTLNLAPDALFAAMQKPEVNAGIATDVEAGTQLPQLRHGARPGIYGIPTIFINGQFVARTQLSDGTNILEDFLKAAVGEK